ncbi:unnamed protein product [Musa textilis]
MLVAPRSLCGDSGDPSRPSPVKRRRRGRRRSREIDRESEGKVSGNASVRLCAAGEAPGGKGGVDGPGGARGDASVPAERRNHRRQVLGHRPAWLGIKKFDDRHYQSQPKQMTMIVPPTFDKELHSLNEEDRPL